MRACFLPVRALIGAVLLMGCGPVVDATCIDEDGDGYGVGVCAGRDCDDRDPRLTTGCCGDGVCAPAEDCVVDCAPCEAVDCGDNAHCAATGLAVACVCDSGHVADGKGGCMPVTAVCGDGLCQETETSLSCRVDCDVCADVTCSGHGTCVEVEETLEAGCACDAGYKADGLECVSHAPVGIGKRTCDDGYQLLDDETSCPEDNIDTLARFFYYARHTANVDLEHASRYQGWQTASFVEGGLHLDQEMMTGEERLLIVAAQILKRWKDQDLYGSKTKRVAEVNRYCAGTFQRSDGTYQNWCSEFVSYVYLQAGVPLDRGDHDYWCHNTYDSLRGWFSGHFVDYFAGVARGSIVPHTGDYLNLDRGGGSGHSMLIIGAVSPGGVWSGKVAVVEGNVEGSDPSKSRVRVSVKDIFQTSEIRGVGVRDLNQPYAILFDLPWSSAKQAWTMFDSQHDLRVHRRIETSQPFLASADDLFSSAFLANGAIATLYRDALYGGASQVLVHSVHTLSSSLDNASSSVVLATP